MRILKLFFIIILFVLINNIYADNIFIHYHRFEKDYDGWSLWLWPKEAKGISYDKFIKDDWGISFRINQNEIGNPEEVGLIIKKGEWISKDIDADRFINVKKYKEFWFIQGDEKIYTKKPSLKPKIIGAYIDSPKKISVLLSKKVNLKDLNKKNISIINEKNKKLDILKVFGGFIIKPVNRFEITLKKYLNISMNLTKYKILIKGYKEQYLSMRNILLDKKFYSDKQMGYKYSKKETLFRIFSPMAEKVELNIYNSVNGKIQKIYQLNKKPKGLWEIKIKKDMLNKYYTYRIYGENGFNSDIEFVDIYSKCNTGRYNKGLIINDKTPVKQSPKFNIEDSIIYELHIRDFTIDKKAQIKNRGKYLGLTETGKKYKNLKTGIDHLIDLGVNVVQIMPVQDFDNNEEDFNSYNWGYMPYSFDSPDGWYASKIDDGSRVKEFKKVVDALHKKNIKVIMDVVYNHTSPNAGFHKMVPGYYFRIKSDGSYWNGSGCGNEFHTEAPMAEKYLIDSLKYWVKDYKIDGFRFDLMGLIDLDTMIKLTKELKKVKKDILIYGEPWAGGDTPVKQTVKGTQKGNGFSVFNDHFRDAIKGSVFNMDSGYVQGKVDKYIVDRIKKGIKGSIDDFTKDPVESINYAACHDNHTLWDKINLSLKKSNDPAYNNIKIKKRMQKLSGAIVLLSQGIPFIHSGQEMCRTKKGDENSYNKDDSINQIDWKWKEDYNDVFKYYKGLISLRKAHKSFKLKTRSQVNDKMKFLKTPDGCIGYQIKNSADKWRNIIVLINPFRNKKEFILPSGSWNLVVNENIAGNKIIKSSISNKIDIESVSMAVLYK